LALTPGFRLGAYKVTAQIRDGDIGRCFEARDPKLIRDVLL
jgi:hypothetical protein